MEIKLHNTLSGNTDTFTPLVKGQVGMYHCGPTVYNYAHIGNLRAYVFADTLRRMFEFAGYEVRQVINITDVGHLTSDADTGADKVEERAKRENRSAADITKFYADAFLGDLADLNIVTVRTQFPWAGAHIAEQIALVRKLEEKGYTYKTSDGIYFDTAKFKDYGKLGNVNVAGLKEGARVEINSEKKHPTDFALWKFSQPHEKRLQEWDSPWSVGFPGWHIECSAMSMKYLGETFDIHTGGIDHIPVHHNNEIAQSVCATEKEYARYWLHSAFVTVHGDKMAKSAGNFTTLGTVKEKGFDPLAYRYWLLTSHYRSPVNFTWDALKGAENTLERMRKWFAKIPAAGTASSEHIELFKQAIGNDLNTPEAIAIAWKVIRSRSIAEADKKATIVEFDRVLGLDLGNKAAAAAVPEEVLTLAAQREEARKAKDFEKSDELRKKIGSLGFDVKDTPEGFEIVKK